MIEEVDIDSVVVVLCADWGNGCNGFFGFVPAGPGHAGAVVDEENGVEVF